MKILKEGNIEKSRNPEKFVCHKCGCEYIADNTEYKIADFWAQQHDGIKAECKCPMCGVENSISFSDSKNEKWCVVTVFMGNPFSMNKIGKLTTEVLFDSEDEACKFMEDFCESCETIGIKNAKDYHRVFRYGEVKNFLE